MSKTANSNAHELSDAAVRGVCDEEHGSNPRHSLNLQTGLQDRNDMHRLGRMQELRRGFTSFSILGFASLVSLSWPASLTVCVFALLNGGLAGTIWTFLAIWPCMMTVAASLGEMASMAPTSAGQYHWVSEFAPPGVQRLTSYVIGWLSALCWQAATAACCYTVAVFIVQAAALNSASYTPTNWQTTLVMILTALSLLAFNVWGASKLPLIEGVLMFLYIFGFVCTVVPLWVLAPKASATEVFTQFSNFGGWSSTGAATVIGTLSATTVLFGCDASAHMAEEIRNAAVVIPRTMLTSIALNGALSFVVIITLCFCITDITVLVAESTAVFPCIDIFLVATNSVAGTTCLLVLLIIMTWASGVSCLAAGSRQAWSFARDGGFPFAGWFRKVTTKTTSTPIPLNAIVASLIITFCLSLINLGSTAAFNAIIGLMTGASLLSFFISISCVFWKKIRNPDDLPHARFWMGKWGIGVNLFAMCFTFFQICICYFPLYNHPTVKSMNWGVAMFGAVVILAMSYYLIHGRNTYTAPVVRIRKGYDVRTSI